jgi:cytosine/adenosine deaminase-related metal-dependent hydrolase
MHYRKLRGDALFDGFRLRPDSVLVMAEDGVVADIVPVADAPDAEFHAGILSPGFVNCHCHLELSHMKGLIPEGTGLVDFVFSIVSQRQAGVDAIDDAIRAGEEEMIRAGIVAVGDICNNESTLAQKREARLHYTNFIEASGWLPAVSEARFERALGLFEAFESLQSSGRAQTSIVPHAPYSVSPELWARLRPAMQQKIVSIHNQETAQEDEFFRTGGGDFNRMYELMRIDSSHHQPTGRSSLQSYYHQLDGAAHVLLVHDTFTTQADIDFIRGRPGAKEPSFCLCINANLYIERRLPPVELLLTNDCHIVLGTDSLASNHSLSIGDEMAAFRKHFPGIPVETLLTWATSNGARALGISDRYGSFGKGKRPGVVAVGDGGVRVLG